MLLNNGLRIETIIQDITNQSPHASYGEIPRK